MPTARTRHTITETEAVARALDVAARRWPEDLDARSRLLLRLVDEGRRSIEEAMTDETERRRAAIARTSGALTGVYEDDYLEHLRREWPA